MLSLVYKLFEDFRLVSLLTLKPAKCVLITSVCATTKWNVDMIRAFLRRQVPAWTSINIKDCAKHLGFFIGRLAGGSLWNGALEKFNGRCLDLKASEQPMSLSIGQFNGRAVPTLGYLAQLVPPPQNVTRVELLSLIHI